MEQPIKKIFVYGTLRPGEGNYRWVKPCVMRTRSNGMVRGRLYHVSSFSRAFPVARLGEEGVIHGDILYCDPTSPLYKDMVDMEIGAGYELRKVTVHFPDGRRIRAEAFHYLRIPAGPPIESGDWFKDDVLQ